MALVEAPPQFPGAPKKSKTGLIIGGIALAIIVCCCGVCGVGGFFGRKVFGKALGLVECSIAMGQQRDALLGYATAKGKLPAAANWQDDIKPYVVKSKEQEDASGIVTIPTVNDGFCDRNGDTSISFNVALAGKKVADVKDPYGTIILFETPGQGRNRSAPYKEQPFASSPVLFQGERRGWIRQPLEGQASYKDKSGRVMPAPTASGARASGESTDTKVGPVDVISKESKNDDGE